LADTLISFPATGKDAERDHVIKEIMDTERKYVQDLEIMQVGAFLSATFFIVLGQHGNT
jgi:hypothetical protein